MTSWITLPSRFKGIHKVPTSLVAGLGPTTAAFETGGEIAEVMTTLNRNLMIRSEKMQIKFIA